MGIVAFSRISNAKFQISNSQKFRCLQSREDVQGGELFSE